MNIYFINFEQAANIEPEASGIHDGEYQLTKHEFSSLGRGKYSGTLHTYVVVYITYFFEITSLACDYIKDLCHILC